MTRPRLPSERALDCAPRFRRGEVFSAYEFDASRVGDYMLLRYYYEPLARRSDEDGQLALRWPIGGVVVSEPATLRAVLNAILMGLELRHHYAWSLKHGQPLFFCRIQGRWRRYHMTPGDWLPITHGELARQALHAEQRQAIMTEPVERMLARMSNRGKT